MLLTQRQQNILKAVITEHVRSAVPVGSKELADRYDFDLSPATVRYEMNALERAGFLHQPHTSAGRVPTDLGYRFYVKSMVGTNPVVPTAMRRRADLQRRVVRVQRQYALLVREMAQLFAELTEQAVITNVDSTVQGEESRAERTGLSNLIKLPELKDSELAQAIANIFDNPEVMMERVSGTRPGRDGRGLGTEVAVPGGRPVKIFIGSETGLGRVPMSVLASSFDVAPGRNGQPGRQGHVILIGPSRMQYSRNVALLSYMCRLLSKQNMAVIVALVLPTMATTMVLLRGIPQGGGSL